MLWGANRGFGWQFRQVIENRGEGISRGAVTENRLISRRLGKAREVILFQTVLLPGLGVARMANPGSILFSLKRQAPPSPPRKHTRLGEAFGFRACRREARPLRF